MSRFFYFFKESKTKMMISNAPKNELVIFVKSLAAKVAGILSGGKTHRPLFCSNPAEFRTFAGLPFHDLRKSQK